jgi:hypothetical protein
MADFQYADVPSKDVGGWAEVDGPHGPERGPLTIVPPLFSKFDEAQDYSFRRPTPSTSGSLLFSLYIECTSQRFWILTTSKGSILFRMRLSTGMHGCRLTAVARAADSRAAGCKAATCGDGHATSGPIPAAGPAAAGPDTCHAVTAGARKRLLCFSLMSAYV